MHKLFNHPKHTTLIQSIVSFYQLSAKTSKRVLEYPNERIDYVNSTWLKDLIQFMARNNIKIITKKYMSIEIQRRNDKCILDEVLQSNLSKSKLIQVNTCRLYLQILFLSDIIEPDGKSVHYMYHSGNRPEYPRSIFKWPRQSNPSKVACKTWHTAMKTILKTPKNGILSPHNTLQQWIIPYSKRHMKHEWYHDTRSKELFQNKENAMIQYFSKETSYHTLQCNIDPQIKTTVIPQSATPTKKRDNNFQCYPQHDIDIVPTNVPMSLK